jgi:hypothetical protein
MMTFPVDARPIFCTKCLGSLHLGLNLAVSEFLVFVVAAGYRKKRLWEVQLYKGSVKVWNRTKLARYTSLATFCSKAL